MKRIRDLLLMLLLLALVIRVIWWAVEPMIPYLLTGVVLVWILGMIYHRRTRL